MNNFFKSTNNIILLVAGSISMLGCLYYGLSEGMEGQYLNMINYFSFAFAVGAIIESKVKESEDLKHRQELKEILCEMQRNSIEKNKEGTQNQEITINITTPDGINSHCEKSKSRNSKED